MPITKSMNVPITVNMTQEVFEKLSASIKDQPVASALSNRATVVFDNMANGGMMLTPDQVRKIEQVIGKRIERGADVVSAVQSANNMEDGAYVYRVKVDPVWIEPLEQRAKEVNRTVDELMSDAINIGFERDWYGGFIPENGPYFLTGPDMKFWQQVTGKEKPSGADITAAFKAAKKEEVAA